MAKFLAGLTNKTFIFNVCNSWSWNITINYEKYKSKRGPEISAIIVFAKKCPVWSVADFLKHTGFPSLCLNSLLFQTIPRLSFDLVLLISRCQREPKPLKIGICQKKIPEMIPTLPVAFSSVIHKIVRKFLPSSVSEHRRSKQHKFYPWKTAFQRDWSSNMSCPVSVDRVLTFFSKFRLLRMCRFLEVWPAKFKIQLKREILIISW